MMAKASLKEKPIVIVNLEHIDFTQMYNILNNQIITEINYSHVLFNGARDLEEKVCPNLIIKLYIVRDGDDAEIGLVFINVLNHQKLRIERVLLDHYSINVMNPQCGEKLEYDVRQAFSDRVNDFNDVISQISNNSIGLEFKIEKGVFI